MADKNLDPVGRRELEGMLSQLGEKAEHIPKDKTEALEEVLANQRRKTRNLLTTLLIGVAILSVLFYFAVKKYYSQFQ